MRIDICVPEIRSIGIFKLIDWLIDYLIFCFHPIENCSLIEMSSLPVISAASLDLCSALVTF
jgi:hypothetical protein